ncbi:hypothetical protein KIN20_022732 [Parelaphostrongylus tenuis]|uniref:Mos1 transposase HTH domain-containing protein n=1 Tax=Parelaphostrongylus tenuis TaxID=148309 RepID=A0AAD5MQP1_PARTN|nr:hypothetical protein KIN20_022732 [Parelaphostrongylus tenuis]
MELSREQKLLLMFYEYKFGSNAADTIRRFDKAWDERTVGESLVRERFRELKAGNEELTDRARSGRPTELDDEGLISGLENEQSLSSRKFPP